MLQDVQVVLKNLLIRFAGKEGYYLCRNLLYRATACFQHEDNLCKALRRGISLPAEGVVRQCISKEPEWV